MGQGVAARDHGHHLVLKQDGLVQSIGGVAGDAQNQIQPPVQQLLAQGDAAIFRDLQLYFRPAVIELGDDVYHIQRGDHGGHAHPQTTYRRGLDIGDEVGQRIKFCDQRNSPLIQHLSIIGKLYPRGANIEQINAQFVLQFFDHLAQRRLGDVQVLGSPGKIFVFGHLDKVFQHPDVHARLPFPQCLKK